MGDHELLPAEPHGHVAGGGPRGRRPRPGGRGVVGRDHGQAGRQVLGPERSVADVRARQPRGEAPPRLPCPAEGRQGDPVGDPELLRQVWEHLLSNAFKFTRGRDRAEVRVESTVAGDEVLYIVTDNGVGFDMESAGKLFGVFQRLHGDEFPGAGAGLAVVQRIVGRHGGRVWAQGEVDRGATFGFALPLHPPNGEA